MNAAPTGQDQASAKQQRDDQARLCEEKVAQLTLPATYPEKPRSIEVIQTHMSWIFLTDRHAYKLKKPVRYDFLDFSTLEARRQDCEAEVRLNQRLAGDVYIGTIPLTIDTQGQAHLGGSGEIVEWLVKMRRLPANRMLDVMIAQGAVGEREIRAIGCVLAEFFQACPAEMSDPDLYRTRLARAIEADCRTLLEPAYDLSSWLIGTVRDAQLALLTSQPELFDARVARSRVLEGHGDLRPEHICLEKPRPVIFDCLEFNRELRIVDTADELAFLSLECERIGAAFIEQILFQSYGEVSGDYPPKRLIDFYKSYRACLRAKLAVWHTHELSTDDGAKWLTRARDYLQLAEKYRPQNL